MNRKFKVFLSILFVFVFLCSCQNTNSTFDAFTDLYLPGKDYQANLNMTVGSGLAMAESETGFYLSNGYYLYYMDKEEKNPVPLCNRPNCLHEKADEDKKTECSAYYPFLLQQIFFYDNALYLPITNLNDSGQLVYCLRKLDKDGTFLEDIYEFPGYPQTFLVHRGFFYYSYAEYEEGSNGNGNISTSFQVVQVSLENKEEKTIYVNDLKNPGIFWMSASGKHLFFYNYGFNGDYKEVGDSGRVLQYVDYDLENQSLHVTDMNAPEGEASTPTVFHDSLIFFKYFYNYDDERNRDLFQMDLNGENQTKIFTAEPTGGSVQWDGTYFYIDNRGIIGMTADTSITRKVWVYDEKFHLVTAFDFSNVDGADLTQEVQGPLFIAEDYIFSHEKTEGPSISSFIYIDKDELSGGQVSPHKVTF